MSNVKALKKSPDRPLTISRTFVTMRRIEENIPHPEQWRDGPYEAAATMTFWSTVPIPLGGAAYEMRAVISLPSDREAFLVGMRMSFW